MKIIPVSHMKGKTVVDRQTDTRDYELLKAQCTKEKISNSIALVKGGKDIGNHGMARSAAGGSRTGFSGYSSVSGDLFY